MDELKYNFLKKVVPPDFNEINKKLVFSDALNSKGYKLYNAVQHDSDVVHLSSPEYDIEEGEPLYRFHYTRWYNWLKETASKHNQESEAQLRIELLLLDPEYNPENIKMSNKTSFYNVLEDLYNSTKSQGKFYNKYGISCIEPPCSFQGKEFAHLFSPKGRYQEIECRLYLNLKNKNIIPFLEEFYKQSETERLPFYFKTGFDDNRADDIVIYTNYKNGNVQKAVDIIKKIKGMNPELFEGSERVSPYFGKVDGFIGFGEEPRKDKLPPNFDPNHLSYTHYRTDAIEEYQKELIKRFNAPKRLIELFNKSEGAFVGRVLMNQREFIEYQFRNRMVSELEKICNKHDYNSKISRPYRELLDDFKASGINPDLLVKKEVDKIFDKINNGEMPNKVRISTPKNETLLLFDPKIYEDMNAFTIKKINNEYCKFLEEPEQKKLQKEIFNDKYNISVANMHLNKDTAMEMINFEKNLGKQ